jgi:hypothetical protein
MKKTALMSGFMLISLLLSACSVINRADPALAGQSGNTRTSGTNARQLPEAMKLALGTLALEKTSYPVDAAEAAQLVFLWKGMRNLSQDQSAANEEIQGLVKQINDTMTPQQIAAINGMNLSFQSIAEIAQQTGLDLGNVGGQFGNLSPQARSTFQASRQSGGGGGFGGGIPGAGGGGGGARIPGFGGGGGAPASTNTAGGFQGRGTSSEFSRLGVSPTMINAVIQFLQAKAK